MTQPTGRRCWGRRCAVRCRPSDDSARHHRHGPRAIRDLHRRNRRPSRACTTDRRLEGVRRWCVATAARRLRCARPAPVRPCRQHRHAAVGGPRRDRRTRADRLFAHDANDVGSATRSLLMTGRSGRRARTDRGDPAGSVVGRPTMSSGTTITPGSVGSKGSALTATGPEVP